MNADRIRASELLELYPALLRHAATWARICRLDRSHSAEDLVQQSVEALYAGAVWPEDVELKRWLFVRIRQIATTQRRHDAKFPREASDLATRTTTTPTEARDTFARLLVWVDAELSESEATIIRLWADGLEAAEIRVGVRWREPEAP